MRNTLRVYIHDLLCMRGKRRQSTYSSWLNSVSHGAEFDAIHKSHTDMFYSLSYQQDMKIDSFLREYKSNLDKLKEKYLHEQNYSISNDFGFLSTDNVKITIEQRDALQLATQSQSNSELWTSLRKNRLTASMAGRIYKSRSLLSPDKLWKRPFSNEATRHGLAFESIALSAVEESEGISIRPSGCWLDLERSWLGATPDGLIYDSSQTNLIAVVEVKCPFKYKFKTINRMLNNPAYYLKKDKTTSLIHLKRNHEYYYQVQMQMAVTNVNMCLFGVYTGTDLFTEWIPFDNELWNLMLGKFDSQWQYLKSNYNISG